MNVIQASAFHPMRGHVEHGNVVVLANGARLRIQSALRGWNLCDLEGTVIAGPLLGAHEVTSEIVRRDLSAQVSEAPAGAVDARGEL